MTWINDEAEEHGLPNPYTRNEMHDGGDDGAAAAVGGEDGEDIGDDAATRMAFMACLNQAHECSSRLEKTV